MTSNTQYFILVAFAAFHLNGNGEVGCAAPRHEMRVVCYWASWAVYLNPSFLTSDVEAAASFCTHIVVLFASLDETNWEIIADQGELNGISGAVQLKEKFSHLKVMACIGGWNDGSVKYSRMARDSEKRAIFIRSINLFLLANKLDGIDLNWQFPGDRGGESADKANLVVLTKELREALDVHGKLLSVAVSALPWRMDPGVDPKGLTDHAHFLNVLSYEYHAKWDNKVGSSTPLNAIDNFSINHTMSWYLNMGANASKLNLGLSAYGTTYLLGDPAISDAKVVGASVVGGFHGGINDVDGFIAYNELCVDMQQGGWTELWDPVSQTPFARAADKIASFDNAQSYEMKIKLAKEKKLGGVIFYGLEKDDFKGSCSSSKGPYPLLRSINNAIMKISKAGYDDLIQLVKLNPPKFFWNGMKNTKNSLR